MKLPIAIFAVILTAIAGAGWYQSRQVEAARARQLRLHQKIDQLALPATGPEPAAAAVPVADATVPPAKRERERDPRPAADQGKLLAAEYIAVTMEGMVPPPTPGQPDLELRARQSAVADRIALLDGVQLKAFITAITDDETLAPAIRRMMIERVILRLAENQPHAALASCLQTVELFENDSRPHNLMSHGASKALESWAQKDFPAALEWLRQNVGASSSFLDDPAKTQLLRHFGGEDYNDGFKLISELQIEPYVGTQALVGSAKTAEQRVAVIEALRAYLPTISDENERWQAGDYALASMGNHLVVEGFTNATRWVESAQLTPVEIASFGKDFGGRIKPGEHAMWLGWIGEKVPANRLKRPINNIINEWTRIDHKAVGNWLLGAPEGPMKNLAVQVFAGEVAAYEPESAVKWALTLPPGKNRQACLTDIYCNLPQNDPAGKTAAEAFAKKYGIE